MRWHVICCIGEDDTYQPALDGREEYRLKLHFSGDESGGRLRESIVTEIESDLGAKLGSAAQDFLYASMAAYMADMSVPRKTARDRWSRSFVLHLPVFETDRWLEAGPRLSRALRFLTGDEWDIRVRERVAESPTRSLSSMERPPGVVSLLSGGADSLVGAIDLLDAGHRVAFVSHHGGGSTPKFQNDVHEALIRSYGDLCHKQQFFAVAPALGEDGENTMRSRSILFLGLGVAVASVLGDGVPLYVPENGLISLNVALTRARSGSSSTRTTHPHFIAQVRLVLESLSIPNSIEMPYRHKTKGEMLSEVADSAVLEGVLSQTMSCSHPEVGRWAGGTPGVHCGYCVPCIIRRASVQAAGLQQHDATYNYDVRSAWPIRERARDLRAFKIALTREAAGAVSPFLRVLESGPLPEHEVQAFADVFVRGSAEVDRFLRVGV